jgi:peptidyl-prolyl cis-trans isomerase A (cyclophilin A)
MKLFSKISALLLLASCATFIHAATIGTFRTPVGSWEIEFYDAEKPITVSNFIKYVTSGRFENQFIHRWVPGFVIQGGQWRVDTSGALQIVPVNVLGTITNEARVGPFLSNTNGTIAMARVGGQTNSATSQWFINLKDNSGPPPNLDNVDNGFTVFGRMISGSNTVNLFFPPSGTHGIYTNESIIQGTPLAVLTNSNDVTYEDLVYVQIALRRDVGLQVTRSAAGERQVSWTGVSGVTNILEYSSHQALATWQQITNVVPVRGRITVVDNSADERRVYRVKLFY